MSKPRVTKSSEYMQWAKTCSRARYNLATSGVINYPMADLEASLDDVDLNGPSYYGYEPLQQALAARFNVSADCVVAATGTSLANHLAMAALLEPGEEVLVESPVYEPILALAGYLGANIRRFRRTSEQGFKLDPEEIARNITARTKLIVITNLHNPSSAYDGPDVIKQIGSIARRSGARVLVDEVYLEAVSVQNGHAKSPRNPEWSAFHLGTEFIVTGSLTKVYGLSGLRCGWVLAEPCIAKKIWLLNDLFGVIPAHPAERLSVIALQRIGQIADRTRNLLDMNRALLNAFLDSRDDLEVVRSGFGTVVFPRLKSGSVDILCSHLRDKHDTTVVPGRFFELPDHFRLGFGCDTSMLSGGLERLGAALDHRAGIS
jgi:aspartate/methionine/tyrosine aminotransferase